MTVPGWARRVGSCSPPHVFNIWVSLAAVSCTFKLAYLFYNQNLHEEASSVCELFCERLQTADAYACPEILPERVSACLLLLAETGLKRTVWSRCRGSKGEDGTRFCSWNSPNSVLRGLPFAQAGKGSAIRDMGGREFAPTGC